MTVSPRARLPLGATIVVALAIVLMIALGVWQLQRRDEKLALLARYAANQHLSPVPMPWFAADSLLFRRALADCLKPIGWSREAGRAADGSSGWRIIVRCRGEFESYDFFRRYTFAVQVGVGRDPSNHPAWTGGKINGYLTHAPQHRALIAGLFSAAPKELMLVADAPLPGLKPNPAANLDDVPNNHLAYAVQWFLFAGIAGVIYAVALWRRRHPVAAPPERG